MSQEEFLTIDEFYSHFRHYIQTAKQYASPELLQLVRQAIPKEIVEEYIKTDRLIQIRNLAKWFKESFMKWDKTDLARYIDLPVLLETRKGRCGEWANLYTAMLISLEIPARLVLDYTDHVWTEALIEGKWMHIDSTLNAWNWPDPFYYEDQWKKQLTYILAFMPNKIEDVTQNYTRKWEEVKTRRKIDKEVERLIEMYNLGAVSVLQHFMPVNAFISEEVI